MNKYEKLNELLKKGNGYLFTSEVEKMKYPEHTWQNL